MSESLPASDKHPMVNQIESDKVKPSQNQEKA